MNQRILPTEWNKLHHGYLVCGTTPDQIWNELKLIGFNLKSNPDAKNIICESFGIDDARALIQWSILKPISGERKVAVISCQLLSSEGQNALLKLFEEPPSGCHFFILLENVGFILPTLLSRMQLVIVRPDRDKDANLEYESFFNSTLADRFNTISSIIKTKDKEKAGDFLAILEQIAVKQKKFDVASKVLEMKKNLIVRGSSVKMILEYLAVSL
jgi:DNA polymerase III delta prime subunit